ncbi:MAG: acyl-ACP--UDP-N-acetylglucosamine O-acyltransferase [Polyangiaceae bacterium]|jgi:UDP-N-acetylglucosamine acyltransferase|nr:acyl-ACP--UDP-N-acetylglucosamine O-acyltransferase [Polyangiaceae bacterium]
MSPPNRPFPFPILDDATVFEPTFLRPGFLNRGAAGTPAETAVSEGEDLGVELVDEGEGEGPETEREPAVSAAAPSSATPPIALSPGARIDPSVEVGPFVAVGPSVEIGPGCRLGASCVLEGPLTLGANNRIYSFAVLGAPPQDRSYAGEPTRLVVGDGNEFREHVTVHRGTAKDRGLTRIGSGGLFMAGAHVAHDCDVGDNVTLANGTLLGGHVTLEEHVVTGGRVAIAPKVRVGAGAFLAAGAMVEQDVPPFVIVAGDRARVRALNLVGLERMGVPPSSREALERAFRHLYHSGDPLAEARRSIEASLRADPYVGRLLAFWQGRD